MASDKCIKIIFGGASLGLSPNLADEAATEDVYKRLEEGGCSSIDTCRYYFTHSEGWLGKTNAGSRFRIDSKTPGGLSPGESTGIAIVRHAREFAEKVGAENTDVYYIHAPDPKLDLDDMLSGINEAHRAGYFKRFGLSNYTVQDVERVHAVCKAKGYLLPTVYQGSYNAVARKPEQLLLPTLRRLGISFHAYSALAGGFLTRTAEQIINKGPDAGRFGGSGMLTDMYNSLYAKPTYLAALASWAETAQKAGCSRADLAYRWLAFDSALSNDHGDALIIGASSADQLSELLAGLKKGSVGPDARSSIDDIWKSVQRDAPLDHYNSFYSSYQQR